MGNAQCCSSEAGGTAPVLPLPTPDDSATLLASTPDSFARAARQAAKAAAIDSDEESSDDVREDSDGRFGGGSHQEISGDHSLYRDWRQGPAHQHGGEEDWAKQGVSVPQGQSSPDEVAAEATPTIAASMGVKEVTASPKDNRTRTDGLPLTRATQGDLQTAGHLCAPTAARSSRAVGVSVGVLEELEEACRALDFPLHGEPFEPTQSLPRLITSYDELACADVVQFAVLPQTKASGCSFAELLQCEGRLDRSTGQPLVGEADCFVSYASQCLFKDFVAAIFHQGMDDQYFWLDFLCFDTSRHKDQAKKLVAVEQVLHDVGYTLNVYDKWSNPTPQTRAWCCFETVATALAGNSIEVALPPEEAELLNNDLLDGKFDGVITAMCSLDGKLDKADSYDPEDKEHMISWAQWKAKEHDVFKCASDAMRGWLARYSRALLKSVPATDAQRTNFANDIAMLEAELDRAADATELLQQTVELHQAELGAEHPSTLLAYTYLANLLEMSGELDEAQQWYQQSLRGYREALGDTHPMTKSAISNLAHLLQSRGSLSGAEPLYEELCKGDTSPKTLSAMHTLGRVKEQLGKTDDAIRIYRSVLDGRRTTLGEQHQQTLAVMADSAQLHMNRQEYVAAIPLLRAIVSVRRRVLGNSHSVTLSSIVDLGRALEGAGDLDGAIQFFSEALVGRQQSLGKHDPSTVASMSCLARILEDRGEYDEAIALWTNVVEAKTDTLGSNHPSTLQAAAALESCTVAQ